MNFSAMRVNGAAAFIPELAIFAVKWHGIPALAWGIEISCRAANSYYHSDVTLTITASRRKTRHH